jgi:hypothetical protein
MVFKKKNKKKVEEAMRKARELKREQIRRALKTTEIQMPEKEKFFPYPAEYLTFLEELEQKPVTWYEKACSIAERIFPVNPSNETKNKLETSLKAAYLNATPKGAYSLALLATIISFSFLMIFIVIGTDVVFSVFGGVLVLVVFMYFYKYPDTMSKSMRMKMSADSVLAILYMVIYMRSSPNLEGAVRFASQYLEGPLAWDLRKLLWDIETGKYASADYALIDYINRWKDKNKEFSEALNLLRGSVVEEARREMVYEETINVILNGTRDRARHYAADLRMPMTLIYAMGILLPVMGLVLFPVVLIFIADIVKPSFVFFGYDILLPVALYFIVSFILSSKPPTFSPPDISKAKGTPPMGKFSLGSKFIPIFPVAVLVAIPLVILGFMGIGNPEVYESVSFSMLTILGFSMIVVVYAFLDSYQKIRIRNDIEKIEDEFATALFQLGNSLSGGLPLELAIDKAKANLKDMKIADMFEIVSLNMKKFGYTFEQALFDREVGALWYYPSKLIHSIMQTIIQSSRKSIKTASNSMVIVSRYLKDVHEVKEEIEEILGETITSMKFLAMFLAPMVAGVTVTLAVIIIQILTKLGSAMQGLVSASGGGMSTAQTFLLIPWAMGGEMPISPAFFQLVVGIYMIETAVLLSFFLNGVKYGEDPVGLRENTWKILLFGIIIYIISWIVTYSMFGSSITALLEPMV